MANDGRTSRKAYDLDTRSGVAATHRSFRDVGQFVDGGAFGGVVNLGVVTADAGRLMADNTRQHGAVEASDALLAIERHAGVKPVELHKIRRQDPVLGRDVEERKRIWNHSLCGVKMFFFNTHGVTWTATTTNAHDLSPCWKFRPLNRQRRQLKSQSRRK